MVNFMRGLASWSNVLRISDSYSKMEKNNMKSARKTKPEKVSAMILKVAQGYIDMGDTVEKKENYLRSACSAWNIA
jgi:hypothetical protein